MRSLLLWAVAAATLALPSSAASQAGTPVADVVRCALTQPSRGQRLRAALQAVDAATRPATRRDLPTLDATHDHVFGNSNVGAPLRPARRGRRAAAAATRARHLARRAAGDDQPAAGAHRRRRRSAGLGWRALDRLDHRPHHPLSHIRHVADSAPERPTIEAVIQGSSERLVPILMTALASALGLLPIVLAAGQPGSEIQAPMAWVILTGLGSATVLNMLVVPAVMLRYGLQRTPEA